MEKFSIYIELYCCNVCVYVGSLEEFKQEMAKDYPTLELDITAEDMAHYASRVIDARPDVVIYATNTLLFYVLLHELAHAAFMILEHVGIPLSDDKEEYSYLLEYLAHKAASYYDIDFTKTDFITNF